MNSNVCRVPVLNPYREENVSPHSRPKGVCKIPPYGLTFFQYKPEIHGPLVDTKFETAKYGTT